MSDKTRKYFDLLMERYRLDQQDGKEMEADLIDDQMDEIWLSMDSAELACVNAQAKQFLSGVKLKTKKDKMIWKNKMTGFLILSSLRSRLARGWLLARAWSLECIRVLSEIFNRIF